MINIFPASILMTIVCFIVIIVLLVAVAATFYRAETKRVGEDVVQDKNIN